MVPISPTKIEVPFHPSWNVTGKGGGKADYRRRTVEYVDSNSRDYKGKDKKLPVINIHTVTIALRKSSRTNCLLILYSYFSKSTENLYQLAEKAHSRKSKFQLLSVVACRMLFQNN